MLALDQPTHRKKPRASVSDQSPEEISCDPRDLDVEMLRLRHSTSYSKYKLAYPDISQNARLPYLRDAVRERIGSLTAPHGALSAQVLLGPLAEARLHLLQGMARTQADRQLDPDPLRSGRPNDPEGRFARPHTPTRVRRCTH